MLAARKILLEKTRWRIRRQGPLAQQPPGVEAWTTWKVRDDPVLSDSNCSCGLAAGGGRVRAAAAGQLCIDWEPRHRCCSGARVWWVSKAEGASEHDRSQGADRRHLVSCSYCSRAEGKPHGEPKFPGQECSKWRKKGMRRCISTYIGSRCHGCPAVAMSQPNTNWRHSNGPWGQSCNTLELRKKGHYHLL